MKTINVLHEDNAIVVINKPAGMVVNRAESVKEPTIQDWMENNYLTAAFASDTFEEKEFKNRSGIVHRLDKETSGVMVLAKTVDAFIELKRQFKDRETKKQYMALVHGKVSPHKGTINLPLKRNSINRRKFTVSISGKMAKTTYLVKESIEKNPNELFTLLHLFPKTGRTHQLRVHLSFLGYPIVSDPIYLSEKKLKDDILWCPRLFLHAVCLSFKHPSTKERKEYSTLLSEDLQSALKHLQQS